MGVVEMFENKDLMMRSVAEIGNELKDLEGHLDLQDLEGAMPHAQTISLQALEVLIRLTRELNCGELKDHYGTNS